MNYIPPKEIAERFSITERTVYNWIKKKPDEIKVKKQDGKTLIDEESFSEAFLKKFPNVSSQFSRSQSGNRIETEGNNSESDSKLQVPLQELQTTLALLKGEKENLEKHNSNLHKMANDYALVLNEMKSEKNSRMEKYDTLQTKYNQTIETFFKRYYLLLGLCLALAIILFFQALPDLQGIIENFR